MATSKKKRPIILIPIIIEQGMERWLSEKGKEVMICSFNTAKSVPFVKDVFVVTNHESVFDLAKSNGMEVFLTTSRIKNDKSQIIFPEAESTVDSIEKTQNMQIETICIFNFRNPFVTGRVVGNAIEEFMNSHIKVHLSLKKTLDHPCQLMNFHRIVDTGMVYLFDAGKEYYCDINGSKYLTTHPFNSEWINKDSDVSEFLCSKQTTEQNNINYHLSKRTHDIGNENRGVFWINEGSSYVRGMVRVDDTTKDTMLQYLKNGTDLLGAAIDYDSGYFSALLTKESGGDISLIFDTAKYRFSPHIVKFIFIDSKRNILHASEELTSEKRIKKVKAHPSVKDAVVIIFTILATVENGPFDLTDHFPAIDALWTIDNITGKKVNAQTGRTINGRQDFPEIYEPDETFVILEKSVMPSIDDEVGLGHVSGTIIDDEISICEKSGIDLFRWKNSGKCSLS